MPIKKTKRAKQSDSKPTVVDVNLAYTIPALCKAIGVDERVVRDLRAKGLRAKLVGERRLMIRGADFDSWLATQAKDAPVPNGSRSN